MIALSVLLLAAAAVMIPFGLASDQGDGLIWASVACTAVALVLLAVGLRRQARSGKLASVPPWALPADEPAPPAAADTARIDVAPAVGDDQIVLRKLAIAYYQRIGTATDGAAEQAVAGTPKEAAPFTGLTAPAAAPRTGGKAAATAGSIPAWWRPLPRDCRRPAACA